MLFKKGFDTTLKLPIIRAIVPDSLVPEVLKDSHGSKLASHPGVRNMIEKLERHVTWPTIAKDVKNHVAKCSSCDREKLLVPHSKTPLQPVVADHVMQHVVCDVLSLPVAPGGFK